jgi:SpoVK/Ycf46/Vps4 family AAA+-type ATPase
MISKAAGNTGGIPTIGFDLSAMKNGIVGSSGERLRTALSIIDAVSGGRSLWLATCNSIASLPPELRRRFTLGTFFFDLPSPEEREAIWAIYTAKYQVGGPRPQDDNWTGAEVKECCRKAYRLRMSLEESAAYIVPVARSASDQIESLRQQSSGKYISASHLGVYEYNKITAVPRGRALRQLATE